MIVPRRYITCLALAFFCLVLIYQFRAYSPSPTDPVLSNSPYHRPDKANDGNFRWQDRAQHFPLQSFSPLPTGVPKPLPRIQHTFGPESSTTKEVRLERRDKVKKVFERCWKSYKERAWMRDELSPLTGTGRDTFGGWAATLVDALDTLWIMDMQAEFNDAAAAAQKINFATSATTTVNVFETTIRYLGGFLGAYDLSGDKRLLDMALEVGEMLLVPFDTPNHMPITRWDWATAKLGHAQNTPDFMLVSELGSLSLEFTRLSQLTGDMRFYDAIKRITDLFVKQQGITRMPGMWPVTVDPLHEDMTMDNTFTLGGMSDSLYEYFSKEYILLGGLEPAYQKLYEDSMKPAIDNLFFRPMVPTEDDILISGDAHVFRHSYQFSLDPRGQHLGCFAGGMLAMGGRLFQNDEHVAVGRKLTEGCIWAYHAMERGVMPEVAHFVPCESKTHCTWNETKWLEAVQSRNGGRNDAEVEQLVKVLNIPKGYASLDDTRYILRPEAIESVFYMWRITGEEKYREDAWKMWTAIDEATQGVYANAAIIDISVPKGKDVPKDDRLESFWFAETVKYFYLIFSEPELISLDDYVLNTEAHPLKHMSTQVKSFSGTTYT